MRSVRQLGTFVPALFLAALLILAPLAGAPRAAPDAGTAASISLPLRAGGPTLIVGAGARIDSVDPDSGNVIGSITPIAVPNFVWRRFLRRGRFLLAEGRTEWAQAPVWHAIRGLVLIDDTGRVRWTETHATTMNRASQAVFLDEEGNVAFDRIDGPRLIKPDGGRVELHAPPAGPVLHGRVAMLPLKRLGSEKVDSWQGTTGGGTANEPPADIAAKLAVRLIPEERHLALVQVVDVAPEQKVYTPEVKTLARLPLPAACRGAQAWESRTMSPRHWLLDCARWPDEHDPNPPSFLFVIDVEARRLRRLTPPPSDQSDVPRSHRRPDDIGVTILADGTILATVWNSCDTKVHISKPGGGWKPGGVAPPFGPPFAPEVVCGRVTLQATFMPPNMGCGGKRAEPATFVRRPDGSWLTVPYGISAPLPGSCSTDAEAVAFVAANGDLMTARLDRAERKVVRTGVGKDAPVAWLP